MDVPLCYSYLPWEIEAAEKYRLAPYFIRYLMGTYYGTYPISSVYNNIHFQKGKLTKWSQEICSGCIEIKTRIQEGKENNDSKGD